MPDELSRNARLATAVVEAAICKGIGEWVVCSGARNLPLIETLMAMPEVRRGKVWNFFEERSAGFFALGRSKQQKVRPAVITTSGTAAAELLPAAIEAHYSGQPLLLITADRPPEFRGSGAPQAIEQVNMLAPYCRQIIDWQAAEDRRMVSDVGRSDGPEHWNVCFREPAPQDCTVEVSVSVEEAQGERPPGENQGDVTIDQKLELEVAQFCKRCGGESSLLVLLGEILPNERAKIGAALAKLGAPIWAEATSGLREFDLLSHLIVRDGDKRLSMRKPKRVLRVGGVPSLRFWRDLESDTEIEVMSVARVAFSGLARDSRLLVGLGVLADGEFAGQVGEVERFEQSTSKALDQILDKFPASEPALFRRLSEHIDPEALVYLGNSLPIREWNLAASYEIPHPHCFASRGANGIDGQVSTFLGLCADGSWANSGAWGIFGDLTTLYDLSAPWVLPQLAGGCKLRFVVINNGGGRIFDRLPAVREAAEDQAAMIRNTHAHDFQHWAAMWGIGYSCWTADHEWIEPEGKAVVIEVRPDEAQTEEFWKCWEQIQ